MSESSPSKPNLRIFSTSSINELKMTHLWGKRYISNLIHAWQNMVIFIIGTHPTSNMRHKNFIIQVCVLKSIYRFELHVYCSPKFPRRRSFELQSSESIEILILWGDYTCIYKENLSKGRKTYGNQWKTWQELCLMSSSDVSNAVYNKKLGNINEVDSLDFERGK